MFSNRAPRSAVRTASLALATLASLASALPAVSGPASGSGPGDTAATSAERFVQQDAMLEGSETFVVRVATDGPGAAALAARYDVWHFDSRVGEATLQVDAADRDQLVSEGFVFTLDVERTAELRDFERVTRAAETETGGGAARTIPGFPCYRTVEETHASLAGLAASRPDLASWIDIGDSWEKATGGAGYDVRVLKLGASPVPQPPLVIIAAMHARELATAELATRFAEMLVAGYGVDPDLTWLLDHREIHLVAHLNPDGRKEAEGGKSWRKNTNNDFCSGSDLRGIDLNRNSSFAWGGQGSEGQGCSEIFRGPSPASEPETTAIEDYLATVFADQKGDPGDAAPGDTVGAFVSIHSYGELVLFPWEHTESDTPNHAQLQTLGRRLGFLNQHVVCQDCLYVASGTTPDVAYGEYGVAAYTFEIGTSFFQNCNSFQNTVLPRNLDALLYMAKAARRPYEEPSGPVVLSAEVAPSTATVGDVVTVTATVDDDRFDSNGQGTEPVQAIVAARLTVDRPPWSGLATPIALTAVDGGFDETRESVRLALDTSDLAPGRHVLYLEGDDASGATGVPTAVYLDLVIDAAIFADDFESGTTGAWTAP